MFILFLFIFDLFFPSKARASDPEEYKKSKEFKNQLDKQNQQSNPRQEQDLSPTTDTFSSIETEAIKNFLEAGVVNIARKLDGLQPIPSSNNPPIIPLLPPIAQEVIPPPPLVTALQIPGPKTATVTAVIRSEPVQAATTTVASTVQKQSMVVKSKLYSAWKLLTE